MKISMFSMFSKFHVIDENLKELKRGGNPGPLDRANIVDVVNFIALAAITQFVEYCSGWLCRSVFLFIELNKIKKWLFVLEWYIIVIWRARRSYVDKTAVQSGWLSTHMGLVFLRLFTLSFNTCWAQWLLDEHSGFCQFHQFLKLYYKIMFSK